ncbi:MAG TPA: hypothetical protein VIL21_08710 [Solirubrobacterales bacterium]
MKRPGNKTILLILAALALAIAGCGGGGDETTDSTAATVEEPTTLTQDELIEQGDAICAEVNAAVGALGSETGEESAVPDQIEKTANLYTGMVERLQDLGTPEGDDGSYAKFMEAAEELAKVEGEVKLAAEREDTAALGEAATEAAPALEEFESQAAIYGFEECSEGPGAVTPAGESGEAGGEEFEGSEEGGVEAEPEYVEPEYEEPAPEEAAPETGGAGGGVEEAAPEGGGGSESGGVGPG